MKIAKRSLAFLIALIILSLDCFYVFAEDVPEEPSTEVVVMEISSPSETLQIKEKLTLTVNIEETVTWSSSDNSVATVDSNGVVTGVSVGEVKIFAKSDDSEKSDDITLFVTNKKRFWRDLLSKHQILSYMYEYKGDYYYTNDKDCWQKPFGFNFMYDRLASLFYLEYDFVRVFFTYEGLDWMIQLWKGQYGFVFYGNEVGVYTKKEGSESATKYSHYAAASEDNYLSMESSLYRLNTDGTYDHEFTREYGKYWWCTGFVPGHLRDTTPCDELRSVTRITMKDAEMTKLFTEGLVDCGFKRVSSEKNLKDDTFYVEGNDVFIQWQNISEAANHTIVQASFWSWVGINGFMLSLFAGISLLALTSIGALFFFI